MDIDHPPPRNTYNHDLGGRNTDTPTTTITLKMTTNDLEHITNEMDREKTTKTII